MRAALISWSATMSMSTKTAACSLPFAMVMFSPKTRLSVGRYPPLLHPNQYLTLAFPDHRTDIVRQSGIVLPKHIFYEDNLFVYAPLPLTKKIIYMNEDLYRYLIGREGQSVSEQVMMKRCTHQIEIAQRIFDLHDLEVIRKENPKLGQLYASRSQLYAGHRFCVHTPESHQGS